MIRKKHNIDNDLIVFFLNNNKLNEETQKCLINWYGSLGEKEYQINRKYATSFLKMIAFESLKELDYPEKDRENLVDIFEPLELLLRTAISLKDSENINNIKNSIKVRDHLSHTLRNLLLSNYILNLYKPHNNENLKRQINIAIIFHDIGYPFEKLKKVAKKLEKGALNDLLNSKGDIHIALSRPDDLLEMLDFFGELQNNSKINATTKFKLEYLYREVISSTIAGKGLFDSPHNLSSVVLFLLPIFHSWKKSPNDSQLKHEKISDICLSMALHDRKQIISDELKFEIPLITKIIRIADELQEWDRIQYNLSYTKDANFKDSISNILSVDFELKHINRKNKCIPAITLSDKILGISPFAGNEGIELNYMLPSQVNKTKFIKQLKKLMGENFIIYVSNVNGKNSGKNIKLFFYNNKAQIDIF